jgi:ethanolamine ammonia-lyase small subunit
MASADLTLRGGGSPDPWDHLSRHTSARIALGRAGGSLRTSSLLDLRLSHARARDAVHAAFDAGLLGKELADSGIASEPISTAAPDRAGFLARPDLGRTLSEASRILLTERAAAWGPRDLVILVSDGLSALAVHRQAASVLRALIPALERDRWSLYPVLIAPFGRVKIQDEVGRILGARQALVLLGERPGLGSPDSLGAYFTWDPAPERTDAERNCISNIRPEGLPPEDAARKLSALLSASARRRLSGVALKDEAGAAQGELR